jgi:DNA-binding response OmpR family regulator
MKEVKVLLIDDERALHVMLKSVLGSHGFEVISAMTGEDGVALARIHKPDLIVLDVIMPTMKGREVCAKLKKDPATVAIPVLFLTAKDSSEDVKAELEVGAVGHVTKPINPTHLVKQMKKVLGL